MLIILHFLKKKVTKNEVRKKLINQPASICGVPRMSKGLMWMPGQGVKRQIMRWKT